MNTLGAAAKATQSTSIKRLNPALFRAQDALGLAPAPLVTRAAVPEALEPDPEPVRARTNAWSDGRRWQETIKATAADYERRGVLMLEKTGPTARVIGSGVNVKVIWLPNRLLDFTGCYTARGGRKIILECKETHEERLPLGRAGGLTVNQVASLRAWALAGAMAAVLWRTPGGAWLAPYRNILTAITAGRKSLLPEHCAAVPLDDVVRLADGVYVQRPCFAEVLSELYPKETK